MIREIDINLSSEETFAKKTEFTASKKEGLMIIDETNVMLYQDGTFYGKYGPGEYILDKDTYQKIFTIFSYKQDLILSAVKYNDISFICTSRVKDFNALFALPHKSKSLIRKKEITSYISSLLEGKNLSEKEIKPYLEKELLKNGLFTEVSILGGIN